MTGTRRLPGGKTPVGQVRGAPGKQGAPATRMMPQWRMGDRVSWGGRVGSFLRTLDDDIHAEIRIEQRTYRVRIAGLRRG
jgi:hypothetical protein